MTITKSILKTITYKYFQFKSKFFKKENYIILIPKYKLAFFYVGKAACSSVMNYLINILENNDTNYPMRSIHTYKFIKVKKSEVPKDYTKFTVVRNPYNRLYSCYLNLVVEKSHLKKELIKMGVFWSFNRFNFLTTLFWETMTFSEFSKNVSQIPDAQSDIHFMSQAYQLTYKNKLFIDEFLKFENLESDFYRFIKKYKLPEIKLGFRNKTTKSKTMSPQEKDLIYKRYKKDFVLLNYSK